MDITYPKLRGILNTVFRLRPREKCLTILIDRPGNGPDNIQWEDRRRFAMELFTVLESHKEDLPFNDVHILAYPSVGSNNNDLPEVVSVFTGSSTDFNGPWKERHLEDFLSSSGVLIALTEFSATAPLKLLAKRLGFRGASMPGFTRQMIPALGLDYERIDKRVREIKERMDRSVGINVVLNSGKGGHYQTWFDTRFREGHASGGLMREDGAVGNLPSGEAYIVPYEGEEQHEASRSRGVLPVQFQNEIVLYDIKENRAIGVSSAGKNSDEEMSRLREEPAYGNIAEVGIGVLGEWGVKASGNTLLDEKLGLHVAFGRSDHFGGITSPNLFRKHENVVHIDRVFVPSIQPLLNVKEVTFSYGEEKESVMRDGELII